MKNPRARGGSYFHVSCFPELPALPRRNFPHEKLGAWQHLRVSKKLQAVIQRAEREAATLRDEYTGSEHLLIGLALERGGEAYELLKARGINRQTALELIRNLRGNQRVAPRSSVSFPRARSASGSDSSSSSHRAQLKLGRFEASRRRLAQTWCRISS